MAQDYKWISKPTEFGVYWRYDKRGGSVEFIGLSNENGAIYADFLGDEVGEHIGQSIEDAAKDYYLWLKIEQPQPPEVTK